MLEESSSTESSRLFSNDGASDVLSPRSGGSVVSVATLEAEIAGNASFKGDPVFSEPDFGPEAVDDRGGLWRSEGSFTARAARESEMVSPTER